MHECRILDAKEEKFEDINSLIIAVAANLATLQHEKSLLVDFINNDADLFSRDLLQNRTFTWKDADRLMEESRAGYQTRTIVQGMGAAGEKYLLLAVLYFLLQIMHVLFLQVQKFPRSFGRSEEKNRYCLMVGTFISCPFACCYSFIFGRYLQGEGRRLLKRTVAPTREGCADLIAAAGGNLQHALAELKDLNAQRCTYESMHDLCKALKKALKRTKKSKDALLRFLNGETNLLPSNRSRITEHAVDSFFDSGGLGADALPILICMDKEGEHHDSVKSLHNAVKKKLDTLNRYLSGSSCRLFENAPKTVIPSTSALSLLLGSCGGSLHDALDVCQELDTQVCAKNGIPATEPNFGHLFWLHAYHLALHMFSLIRENALMIF